MVDGCGLYPRNGERKSEVDYDLIPTFYPPFLCIYPHALKGSGELQYMSRQLHRGDEAVGSLVRDSNARG